MSAEPDSAERPTLRAIARAAGVSVTVVSRALRNNPKVSPATRKRVELIAQRLGYRPDTQVSKLMYHLRMHRKPSFRSLLCALTTFDIGSDTPYMVEIIESARTRADTLGHKLDIVRIQKTNTSASLTRIFRNRGVEGVLLLAFQVPCTVSDLLDWTHFSIVSATHAVLAPKFHCVTPDQFGNTIFLCRELAALGYSRIGLVTTNSHDLRVRHGFSGAVAWQSLLGGTETVRPLLNECLLPGQLHEWFKRERPDVVIGAGVSDCLWFAKELSLTVPGPVGFVAANRHGPSIVAGIDERPGVIGAAAVDRLHAQIICGEKGIPAVPFQIMVPGKWILGESCRRSRA